MTIQPHSSRCAKLRGWVETAYGDSIRRTFLWILVLEQLGYVCGGRTGLLVVALPAAAVSAGALLWVHYTDRRKVAWASRWLRWLATGFLLFIFISSTVGVGFFI